MMYDHEKSDPAIVAVKPTNKAGQPAAELVEPRAGAEGNVSQQSTGRAQYRGTVSQALERIRKAARQRKKEKFAALFHHVSIDHLEEAFFELKENAAAGVDGLTCRDYEQHLEHNLEDEEDFLGFSYGFRPGRGTHDAMDALLVGITSTKVNWILDADIRSFFDTVSQEWLIKFVEHRVGDRRIIRLIQKWLKAGVLEDGIVTVSDKGTGQGSVISPLLANLYLHYVLDLWAERWRRREATGDMIIVRYADDCVPRTHRRKKVRNCVRDGGRSSGAGRQGQAPNHRKLRRSKAEVVSVAEKAGLDPVRYGSERRARANR